MILLDTDHVSVLRYRETPAATQLEARIDAFPDPVAAIAVVTAEEQMRGWLVEIARAKSVRQQIPYYRRLAELFEFYREWDIAPFDNRAADVFDDLRRRKVRIGTMDLKIAAIALANGALLLSANLRDYRKVPGLRVEDWLRP
jgi:tRNA(fMet)-specific endonuclease VapC